VTAWLLVLTDYGLPINSMCPAMYCVDSDKIETTNPLKQTVTFPSSLRLSTTSADKVQVTVDGGVHRNFLEKGQF